MAHRRPVKGSGPTMTVDPDFGWLAVAGHLTVQRHSADLTRRRGQSRRLHVVMSIELLDWGQRGREASPRGLKTGFKAAILSFHRGW